MNLFSQKTNIEKFRIQLKEFIESYAMYEGYESLNNFLIKYDSQYIGKDNLKGFYTSIYYDINNLNEAMEITEYNFIFDTGVEFLVTSYFPKTDRDYMEELEIFLQRNFTNSKKLLKNIRKLSEETNVYKYFVF